MKQKMPLIDAHGAKDIINEIAEKARTYTPEWKYDPDNIDGGGAVAALFAQMFAETVDRLNRMPYKYYLEFLNLLGVWAKSITPATGVARFEMADGAPESVLIKKNTRLYYDIQNDKEKGGENGDNRILFETQSDFYAVPGNMTAAFNVNPRLDIIEKLDFANRPAVFFNPSSKNSIQRHHFSIDGKEVCSVKSPALINIRFDNSALRYRNGEFVARLADKEFARWTYLCKNGIKPFDSVEANGSELRLVKDNDDRICRLTPPDDGTDGDNKECNSQIFCDISTAGQTESIIMDSMLLGSSYLYKEKSGVHILPSALYANDIALDTQNGGYCFGTSLMAYNSFYIASDEVFSKHGALINIEFQMKTVSRQIGETPTGPIYDFKNKYIVEKTPEQVITPDLINVSHIIWEYWNGFGWKNLKVDGNLNPFDCKSDGKKAITFTCPEDFSLSQQNSITDYFLRARIVEVENPFAPYAQMLLPYAESVSLDYDYGGNMRPAGTVYIENNCESASFCPERGSVPMPLFEPLSENVFAVYLAFDRPPCGYPINLYIRTQGQTQQKRLLSFEYYGAGVNQTGQWKGLKADDRTNGLEEDGIFSIFSPPDYKKVSIFGHEGYFLRVSDHNLSFNRGQTVFPIVLDVMTNAVEIMQRQTVTETFRAGLFESGKELTLSNRPVIDCECWVNEISDISQEEQQELQKKYPQDIKTVKNSEGHIEEYWVRWRQCNDLRDADAVSRNYILDSYSGKITFGNGIRGHIPSAGRNENIRVKYSFGGGRRGNLPAGSIVGLVSSLPYIERVTNPEMTCGGNDRQNLETLERVGPQKLRHHGRAVTAADYENIVLEQFPEIKDVRCVANYDRYCRAANGHVTVVVKPLDIENHSYAVRLSTRVEQYLKNIVSCELLSKDRLAVVPAIVMKVDVTVSITVDSYEFAAQAEKNVIDTINTFLSSEEENSSFEIGRIPKASDFFGWLKHAGHVINVDEILLEGRYYERNSLKIVPLDGRFQLKYAVVTNGSTTVKII